MPYFTNWRIVSVEGAAEFLDLCECVHDGIPLFKIGGSLQSARGSLVLVCGCLHEDMLFGIRRKLCVQRGGRKGSQAYLAYDYVDVYRKSSILLRERRELSILH